MERCLVAALVLSAACSSDKSVGPGTHTSPPAAADSVTVTPDGASFDVIGGQYKFVVKIGGAECTSTGKFTLTQ